MVCIKYFKVILHFLLCFDIFLSKIISYIISLSCFFPPINTMFYMLTKLYITSLIPFIIFFLSRNELLLREVISGKKFPNNLIMLL